MERRVGDDTVDRGRIVGSSSAAARKVTRLFVGWSQALPESAASWFMEQVEAPSGEIDAGDMLWVFAGARAGREFLRRIAEASEARGLWLIPPRTATPGAVADLLLDAAAADDLPPASDLEMQAAWAAELAAQGRGGGLAALLGGEPPDPRTAWDHAGRLARSMGTLREEGLDPSVVAARIGEEDHERWRAIAALDEAVDARLMRAGLCDPKRRARQLLAAGALLPWRVVAAGVLEWSGLQRDLLAASGATMLVQAPPERAAWFDDLGAVRSDGRVDGATPVPLDAIEISPDPRSAAVATIDRLAAWSTQASVDEVAVGLVDDTLGGELLRAGRDRGVALHLPSGVPATATVPGRLLQALRAWLETRSAAEALALLRQPLAVAWLSPDAGEEVRTALPAVASWLVKRRLPRRSTDLLERAEALVGDPSPRHRSEPSDGELESLAAALRALEAVGDRFAAEDSLRGWSGRVALLLGEVADAIKGERSEDAEALREGFAAVGAELRGFAAMPTEIAPNFGGPAFIDLLLDRLAQRPDAAESAIGEVEALGWLELAADAAPHLAIVGLHDEAVPGGAAVDPLLPESLRKRLGMPTHARSVARDGVVLEILQQRCASLRVIVPRRSAEGEPRLPSRLLLQGEGEALAKRVLRLLDEGGAEGDTTLEERASSEGRDDGVRFGPPAPRGAVAPDRVLPVTAFRQYLADPVRFHLRFVERLDEVHDDAIELDALAYGALAHDVLQRLGQEASLRQEHRADAIAEALADLLAEEVRRRYGPRPRASIAAQVRGLGRRLAAFAKAQAREVQAGWTIELVEHPFEVALPMPDGEPPQRIRGRVDRIDLHAERGVRRVLDYKTGEKGDDPIRSHCRGRGEKRRWVDLQLPLYRALLAIEQGWPEASIEVGYATLGREIDRIGIQIARSWSDNDFLLAIAEARRVVRAIRAGEFPKGPAPPWPDAFSTICGEMVLATGDDGGAEIEGGGDA